MELAFLTPLLKDGADSISGGVTIDDESFLKTWLTKDGGRADSVDEGLEGGFVLIFPKKTAALHTVCDQGIEQCGKHTEIVDIHVIEVKESKESTQLLECRRSFPVFNPINFDGIHGDTVLADDDTKVFNFCDFKLTFLWFEV